MIDLSLLRIVKYREQFDKVSRYIPKGAIDKRTKAVVTDFKKYFEQFPEAEAIDLNVFSSLFFTQYHKGMKEEDQEYYRKLIGRIRKDEPDYAKKGIVNNLLELAYATRVANAVDGYNNGDDLDIVPLIAGLTRDVENDLDRVTNAEFARLDEDLMTEESDGQGLEWALNCLNAAIRAVIGGDLVIVAARPDAGKTTFLTYNLVHMATQLDDGEVIIWLNNESKKERILRRCLQSALKGTRTDLIAKQRAGTMLDEYLQIVGNKDKIRIYDIHGWDNIKVQELLETIPNKRLVVVDMIDNVKFRGMRTEQRTDQVLEQQYQWFRELSVIIDTPIIATSQVSTEGDGMQFPELHMLKDSKTGKQGACDQIIMLGKSNDPTLNRSRFLSCPKNKLAREGADLLRAEILFDADRAIFMEHD